MSPHQRAPIVSPPYHFPCTVNNIWTCPVSGLFSTSRERASERERESINVSVASEKRLTLYSVMPISITECFGPPPKQRKFIVDFYGTTVVTTVTSTASVVRKWLRMILYLRRRYLHRLVIGLGVQWSPDSSPGEDSPAATLQLCVGRRCLIFQLLRSDSVPKLLRRFLLNPNNTFVGMWNHSDFRKLLNSKHELCLSRKPLDLKDCVDAVSRNNGMSLTNPSREMIVSECLGNHRRVVFDELINVSDWEGEELSKGQILQACLDAYTSFLIGKDMNAWELW